MSMKHLCFTVLTGYILLLGTRVIMGLLYRKFIFLVLSNQVLRMRYLHSRCDEPVTVTVNVKVKGDDVDWTHVFTSGDELAVPGLGIDVKGVAKAGLFIRVKLEPDDNILTVKVCDWLLIMM